MGYSKMEMVSSFILKLQLFFFNHFKHINIECGKKCKLRNLQIASCGKNNTVMIGNNVSLKDISIKIFGNNNLIKIGDDNNFSKLKFAVEDNGNIIEIGLDSYIGSNTVLAALEGTVLKIGSGCMISDSCEMRTSDSHSLLSENGMRINYAKDIIIGNHVWIGLRTIILKGAIIPPDSVVSAKSVVCAFDTNSIQNGCLIGGVPAKVIKRNINWCRERIIK